MVINGHTVRIGSWSEPYVEEILRGGYVHNPVYYIEGQGRLKYQNDFQKSWDNACKKIKKAGHELLILQDHRGGNSIYILKKSFFNLSHRRLIEEKNGYKMYRLEDRNIFFRPDGNYKIVSCRTTISDILIKEVESVLDDN